MGTGNSFLRDFTEEGAELLPFSALIEQQMRRACDVDPPRSIAGGVLHYINILSIGFVADVNGLPRAPILEAGARSGYIFAVVTEVAGLHSRACSR